MYLNEGDSGNIISSKKLDFNKINLSYKKIQLNVIQEGHFMYLEVLRKSSDAIKNDAEIKATPQLQTSSSKTYFTKDWGLKQIFKLYKNLIIKYIENIITKAKLNLLN